MRLDPEFWSEFLTRISSDVMNWLPALAGALLLLLLGWIVARLARAFFAGLLRRLGVDRLAQRVGASKALEGAGLAPSVAELIGRLVFWIVLLVFVLAAAESLGLQGLAGTMGGLIAYLPKVFAAGVILLLGGLIARLVGDAIGAFAAQSGAQAGVALGQAVRYILLIFIVILAVEQLGIEATLLTAIATVVFAALALAVAVAFGLGSRELARNIMAGFHAKESFSIGQKLTVREHTGRLVAIGSVKCVLETGTGRLSLPNCVLTEEEVTVVEEAAPEKPDA